LLKLKLAHLKDGIERYAALGDADERENRDP
jgi:hypothetical protein